MDTNVLAAITDLLVREGIAHRRVHHPPTFTSEESAAARGEDIRVGGKAILMKTGNVFRLFVLSAPLKIDSSAVKRHFGVNKVRFATPEELQNLTGLVPGSVPPFGPPILPLELFADPSILEQTKIAFNAGSLTDSIVLSVQDYVRVAKPTLFAFASPTAPPASGLPSPPPATICDEIVAGRLLNPELAEHLARCRAAALAKDPNATSYSPREGIPDTEDKK